MPTTHKRLRRKIAWAPFSNTPRPISKAIALEEETARADMSPTERCILVINGFLSMGLYTRDCNFLHITIGHFDREVVLDALEDFKHVGWDVAQIDGTRRPDIGWSISLA